MFSCLIFTRHTYRYTCCGHFNQSFITGRGTAWQEQDLCSMWHRLSWKQKMSPFSRPLQPIWMITMLMKTSATHVKQHLADFGLMWKDPERLAHNTQVLSLQVCGEQNNLYCKRRSEVPKAPKVLTWWKGRKLVGHLPVCDWLCIATAFITHRATVITFGWDDEVRDSPPQQRDYEHHCQSTTGQPCAG